METRKCVDIHHQELKVSDKVLVPIPSNDGKFVLHYTDITNITDDDCIQVRTCDTILRLNNYHVGKCVLEDGITGYVFPLIKVVDEESISKVVSVDKDSSVVNYSMTKCELDLPKLLFNNFTPLIENDYSLLIEHVMASLRHYGTPKKKVWYRMDHTDKVASLSQEIYQKMTSPMWFKQCNKKYSTFELIFDNGLEWLFDIVAYMHDMFKFADSSWNVDHGVIAAKQFNEYCKLYDIPVYEKVIVQMHDAIANHSKKDLYLDDNIFFDVLCDADILSKYTMTNLKEKSMYKYNEPIDKVYDRILHDNNRYTEKTYVAKEIYADLINKLEFDLRNELIRSKLKETKKEGFENNIKISNKFK